MLVLLAGLASASWQPPAHKTAPAAPSWVGRIPATDDRGVDVLSYALDLDLTRLPPDGRELAGEATVTVRLLDPPPAAVRLDLVDALAVATVLCDGQAVPHTHAGDSLLVPLATPTAGDTVAVTVAYAGRPPRHGPLFAGFLMREHGDGQPTVGNVNQPYSSHSWFPCKDHPSDKATLTLTVTAPDTLTVVATGRLESTAAAGPGRRAWHWRSDHPVAPYLVGIAASDFTSWQEDCGGVPLEFHAWPEHLARVREAYAPTCAMMQWLSDLAGPYPFADEKYAQAQFSWGGAMENQTASVMGVATLLLPPRDAQLVVVHELAHQWFGNSLTPARWRDLWLNEGFARYVECLWLEHSEGPAAYRKHLALLRRDDLFAGDGLLGDPDPVLPNALPYDKGAWVLHMLRGYLGDDAFFAALREYATHPDLAYGHVDRDAFAAVWSQASGRDIAAFLRPWLTTEALPVLAGRWRDLGGGRWLIEVLQQQTDAEFRLAVPVRVLTPAGAELVTVRLEGPLGRAEVRLPGPVEGLVIDPDRTLLRRTASTPAPRVLAAQPRPNPARDVTRLAFRLAADDRVGAAVYDARGRLVRRVDLGLRRATGEQGAPHVWIWNGRDATGRRVAAGVYWLELTTPDDRTVRKVTLIR